MKFDFQSSIPQNCPQGIISILSSTQPNIHRAHSIFSSEDMQSFSLAFPEFPSELSTVAFPFPPHSLPCSEVLKKLHSHAVVNLNRAGQVLFRLLIFYILINAGN